jgi:hypothetical protein
MKDKITATEYTDSNGKKYWEVAPKNMDKYPFSILTRNVKDGTCKISNAMDDMDKRDTSSCIKKLLEIIFFLLLVSIGVAIAVICTL